ncbi:hypothetical protein CHGG_06940 [Chaetomium globosum CBS 148.51]|uniref:Uncharacterized protein n=1 Tax=Chaetomium globosum (strain ATCC 6205 / CBS 148.51 / DSM 1962 / NBRC 6347 / NRRL 1970) TaxID=306901 RepID=Q2GYL4_CHAGB|nr:uncharacterized protein CHGG_06940 [Chaetomium globosum CBS 148.51]EAQ85687.1 hypothetical protein CHGG_06940 [Chaetomium globosum CBS 148.51]
MILQPATTPEADQQLALFQAIPWCAAHLSGYPHTLAIGPSLTQRRSRFPGDVYFSHTLNAPGALIALLNFYPPPPLPLYHHHHHRRPQQPPRPRTPHHPRPRVRRARPHAQRLGRGVPRRGGEHADGRDDGAGVCGEPAARVVGGRPGDDGVSEYAVFEGGEDGDGAGTGGGDGYGKGGQEGREEVLDGGGCPGWGGGGAGEGRGVVCGGEGDVVRGERGVGVVCIMGGHRS